MRGTRSDSSGLGSGSPRYWSAVSPQTHIWDLQTANLIHFEKIEFQFSFSSVCLTGLVRSDMEVVTAANTMLVQDQDQDHIVSSYLPLLPTLQCQTVTFPEDPIQLISVQVKGRSLTVEQQQGAILLSVCLICDRLRE